jgi:uncharacterized membrane protein YvlD (DUF360 family)
MKTVRELGKFLFRLSVVWLVDAVSILITAAIVAGITIQGDNFGQRLVVAIAVALVLGIVNFLIRPIILLLSRSLGLVFILVVGIFLNAIVLEITSALIPQFTVSSWWYAFVGGLIFSAINTVITNLMTIDDEDSFYEGLVRRLAVKNKFPDASGPSQGLVMLEVDGLSYYHMQKALADGWMPNLKELVDQHGYKLSHVETGVPSMTSSCQAGILYGDNYDIPSFRWLDRDLGKFITSSSDAALIDQRLSKGTGLVRGGSSIGNMLNGDALKSILVIAAMKTGSEEEKKLRAQDIYLMMLNPYFFVRALVLYFWDVLVEVVEWLWQVIRNVQPRLNRLHKGYPLMRAALTGFMKDVAAYLIILDVIRGTPALYHTYAGYDEVAHHSGPWTKDAFRELKRFDKVIGRILRVMVERAPRPYELIILSDHGQSFGATFLQRYGLSIHDFIQQHTPQGTSVFQVKGSDDGSVGVMSMMDELDNIQGQDVGGSTGRAVVGQANKLLKRGVDERMGASPDQAADVKVAYSGNLANVYFEQFTQRPTVSQLNAAFPGMLDALVQHEGIGFVIGLDDDREPICFGKKGACNLHTGDVTGEDPLIPFAYPIGADRKAAPTPEMLSLRLEQERRLADFPHSGDLIINSTLYDDGTVAAMEELIGNHGGIGGEQTDAFILHPGDMQVPATKNSLEVYAILNARRGLVPHPKVEAGAAKAVDPWALSTISKGLGQVGVWLGRAVRALILERGAYGELRDDPYMTAPGALIILLAASFFTLVEKPPVAWQYFLERLLVWVVTALVLFGAGRLLGSKAEFPSFVRPVAFATVANFLILFGLIPGVAPLARLIVLLVTFLTTWMGAAIGLKISGWKTLLLPILAVVVLVVGMVLLNFLFVGAAFTLNTLASEAGILP